MAKKYNNKPKKKWQPANYWTLNHTVIKVPDVTGVFWRAKCGVSNG